MRAVVQRAREARVEVEREIVGVIGKGLVVFVGMGKGDTIADARYLVDKIAGLRIFEDKAGKMSQSVADAGRRAPPRQPVHALRRREPRPAPELRRRHAPGRGRGPLRSLRPSRERDGYRGGDRAFRREHACLGRRRRPGDDPPRFAKSRLATGTRTSVRPSPNGTASAARYSATSRAAVAASGCLVAS